LFGGHRAWPDCGAKLSVAWLRRRSYRWKNICEPGKFHTHTEQRLRVPPQTRYRVPDLCVMALPYQSESVFTHPPHLIIEILSPDDEPADMLAKIADYLKFGSSRYGSPTRTAIAFR
jgi:hypothetical protein